MVAGLPQLVGGAHARVVVIGALAPGAEAVGWGRALVACGADALLVEPPGAVDGPEVAALVEQLAAAVERPVLVRVASVAEVARAFAAGADGAVLPGSGAGPASLPRARVLAARASGPSVVSAVDTGDADRALTAALAATAVLGGIRAVCTREARAARRAAATVDAVLRARRHGSEAFVEGISF